MSPSPVLPDVHNKKMKNLLSSLDVDLEHDITGHKLHKHCEWGTIHIKYKQTFILPAKSSSKLSTKQDGL